MTAVKIFTCRLLANMPEKQNSINSNNPDAFLKVFVFVNHMSSIVAFLLPVSIVYVVPSSTATNPR